MIFIILHGGLDGLLYQNHTLMHLPFIDIYSGLVMPYYYTETYFAIVLSLRYAKQATKLINF